MNGTLDALICLYVLHSDLNHTPFGQHQMEGTLAAYSRLVVQLLCFLLRTLTSPSYVLVLPSHIHTSLTQLSQLAAHPQSPDVISAAVHLSLFQLWTREWSPTQLNPFPDPTLRFVIHTQVNRDGSLKPPKDVTGIFAKMAYNMVSVLFTLSS